MNVDCDPFGPTPTYDDVTYMHELIGKQRRIESKQTLCVDEIVYSRQDKSDSTFYPSYAAENDCGMHYIIH